MTKLRTGVLVCAAACLAVSTAAIAANRKAQSLVEGLKEDQATLLTKFPALAQIDSEIRADCSTKNEGNLPDSEYCRCASAVTIGLWRSGADPKMITRLTEYLNAPTAAGAKTFLQYQGPELYRPLCTEASRR